MKNISTVVCVLALALSAIPASAMGRKRSVPPAPAPTIPAPLPDGTVPCQNSAGVNIIDPTTTKAGFKCFTVKGAVYARVDQDGFGTAWKDSRGVIWSDVAPSSESFDQAEASCAKFGGALPSVDDYNALVSTGGDSLLPSFARLVSQYENEPNSQNDTLRGVEAGTWTDARALYSRFDEYGMEDDYWHLFAGQGGDHDFLCVIRPGL